MEIASLNAQSAPQAAGGYSQAVEVAGALRRLYVSSQIPETVDGRVPSVSAAQAPLARSNVFAQLAAANMTAANLIKAAMFLSSRQLAIENREIRKEALGGFAPALTVIIVDIFDEKWVLEIEAAAAA